MPQLDQVNTFISQLFWLVATFIPLYFILWKVALPRISATLEDRQRRIDNDLNRATELAEQAEEVMAAYEARLAEARAKANEELHNVAQRAAAETERRNAALGEKLAADAAAARTRIASESAAAVGHVTEIAEDIARQTVERLIGRAPEGSAVQAAVAAAVEESNR